MKRSDKQRAIYPNSGFSLDNEFCIDLPFSMDNETALAILVSSFAFFLYLLCTTIEIAAPSCTHVVNTLLELAIDLV